MAVGLQFPDLPLLHREMAKRGWDRSRLAAAAGISLPAACRAVDGGRVQPETIEAVSRALVAHPPDSATATLLAKVS